MGTVFQLDLYARDEAQADELMDASFDEIDRLEALLSNYRPASELSRIGRDAGVNPVTTDPETFAFLQRSLFWSRTSDGAFDITVGPLLRTWGFFAHQGHVPKDGQLAAARARVGWWHIGLTPETHTVAFAPHRPLELDPGSIGKGFAVDSVVRLLRAEGVSAALISAGGSTLFGLGAPPGRVGWPVQVPDPRRPGARSETVMLHDMSLSTGACTQKFFLQDGHRYCHIFDPRSGRPVEEMLQTTVIDPSATDSDALSTVVFVLRPEQSRQLLASRPESRALLYRPAAQQRSCIALHWSSNPCEPLRVSTEEPSRK